MSARQANDVSCLHSHTDFFLIRVSYSPMLDSETKPWPMSFTLWEILFIYFRRGFLSRTTLTFAEGENGKFRSDLCFLSYRDRVWNGKWPVCARKCFQSTVNHVVDWQRRTFDKYPITIVRVTRRLWIFRHDLSPTLISSTSSRMKINASLSVVAREKAKLPNIPFPAIIGLSR